jgi:hypothetical protein
MMLKFGLTFGKARTQVRTQVRIWEHHSQDLISYRNDFLRTKETFARQQ